MRVYEVLFIAAPNAPEAEVEKVIEQMRQTVTDLGGTVTKVDRLGRRRMAYEIGKFREGDYILAVIEGSGREIAEVERRFRVAADIVLRYITVRVDEELKRADKLRAARQARVAGRSSGRGQAGSGAQADAEATE